MIKEVSTFLDMNCVFVSIPKTATQSIWNSILSDLSFRPFQHVHAKVMKNAFEALCPGKWDEIYKFAVVRNPVELVTSWYTYHTTHSDISDDVKLFYPSDINEWIMNEDFHTHWQRSSHAALNSFWDPSINPLHQHSWVTNDSGEQIVDCILRQEQLSSEISKLDNNVKFYRPLEKLNSTERPKVNLLTKDSISKIITTFSKDFEMFGYNTESRGE